MISLDKIKISLNKFDENHKHLFYKKLSENIDDSKIKNNIKYEYFTFEGLLVILKEYYIVKIIIKELKYYIYYDNLLKTFFDKFNYYILNDMKTIDSIEEYHNMLIYMGSVDYLCEELDLSENVYEKFSCDFYDYFHHEFCYFINTIHWDMISSKCQLEEWFIEKYIDCFKDLDMISLFQNLSIKFIEKYKTKLDYDELLNNEHNRDDANKLDKIKKIFGKK